MSDADEFVRLLRLDTPQDTIAMPTTERNTKRFWALADQGQVIASSKAAEPDDFGSAVRVLVRLYRRCERKGNANLARRVQAALAALLGPQKHLRDDDGSPASVMELAEHTLRGLGP